MASASASAAASTPASSGTVSTASTALSDQLTSSVPRLDPHGLNWAAFSLRFQDAVEAKGFWGHFDGTEPKPQPVNAEQPTAEEKAAISLWEKNERSAKSLLTQKLPDSALMRIRNKKTVRERWQVIETDFTEKGTFAQTELRAKFLDMKCPDKANVREFLDGLRTKREELATMAVDVDEKDYRSTTISSLPVPLANFASNQLASAKLYAPSKTIAPDSLISLISEEYDRQQSQRAARYKQKKAEEVKDEALVASSSSSSTPNKQKRKTRECWNCGKPGHFKDKCPHPKKESNRPRNANVANAAVSDTEEEVAFFFIEDDECLDDEEMFIGMDREVNEGSRVDARAEELSEVNWSESGSLVDVDSDSAIVKHEQYALHVDAKNRVKGAWVVFVSPVMRTGK